MNGFGGLKFWQSSNECKLCGLVLRDDLSAEDRRDDLFKKSALTTNNDRVGLLCASCRLIQNDSQFEAAPSAGRSKISASRDKGSDENYIVISSIINRTLSKGKNYLFWVFIGVFAIFKISGITNLFDDEALTDIPEIIYEEEPNEAPTRVLEGDSAVPFNSPAQWVGPFDYPSDALRYEREGTTQFELTVSEQGKVSVCNIIVSSGHSDLDEATCGAIIKRASFYKGLDSEGVSIESKYRNRVRWQIPE